MEDQGGDRVALRWASTHDLPTVKYPPSAFILKLTECFFGKSTHFREKKGWGGQGAMPARRHELVKTSGLLLERPGAEPAGEKSPTTPAAERSVSPFSPTG